MQEASSRIPSKGKENILENVPESDSDAPFDFQPTSPARAVTVEDLLGKNGETEFDAWGVGIHYDLPENIYHEIPAVSNSALKQARRSFRHFKYYVEGGEFIETPSMVFGRIGHRALLEHEKFQETVLYTEFTDKRSSAWKKTVRENPDKMVLTQSEANQLVQMFRELSQNQACMDLIAEGRPEVTILAIDPITKLRLKCRIDWVSTSKPYLLDYKTTEDAGPTILPEKLEATNFIRSSKFERNANILGYENQGAFYLFMAGLAGLQKKYFAVIAQETKAPYVPCPYVYGFETIDEAAEENRETLNRVFDAISTNKFPGYAEKPVVLARPSYARKV